MYDLSYVNIVHFVIHRNLVFSCFFLWIVYIFFRRNVILVVGDGMSLTTATAARILRGQRRGLTGEDTDLAWDTFPAVALAKVCHFLIKRINQEN